MSFLQHYIQDHRLAALPEKVKKNLEKLEGQLKSKVDGLSGPASFEECIKAHGPAIADLVERVSKHVAGLPPIGWGTLIPTFKFVHSIAVEVFQIVDNMSKCVVNDSMTPEEKHKAKVSFGRELVYFVWQIVDPLRSKFNWVPFKATIVKIIVKRLSGVLLESLVDFFAAQSVVGKASAKQAVKFKALL